jgi:hypothetical protein
MTMNRIWIAVFALAVCAVPTAGQTIESVAEDVAKGAQHIALGDHYLSNYFRRNMEVLATFWDDDTTMGGATGVDSLMVSVPAAWKGVDIEKFHVVSRFASGDDVVNYFGTLSGTLTWGEDRVARVSIPFQTVLRFRDGRIADHEDFFNVNCMNRQVLAQADGMLSYSLLPPCVS